MSIARGNAGARALRGRIAGRVVLPGDTGWDFARQPWNLGRPATAVSCGLSRVRRRCSSGRRVRPQAEAGNRAAGDRTRALSLGSLEDTILLNTASAMRTTDWGAAPVFPAGGATSGERETPWVDPARFFAGLSEVMAEVPARPGEEAWYRWLESLLQAAADDRWRSC